MTADCREGCTPTAPSRVGRSKIVTFRARNWLLRSKYSVGVRAGTLQHEVLDCFLHVLAPGTVRIR